MKLKSSHISIICCVLSFLINNISQAALVKSNGTGGGNWNDINTWIDEFGNPLGGLPQDGDEIIIDTGDIVTIPIFVEITLNNVTIAVRGELSIPFLGALTLDANSVVVVETGGTITGFLSFVTIGGTTVPIFVPLDGPVYIDTGGSQPGTPPGYIPLPIELISFDTNLSGSVVEIEWATATELNNEYFTIERSDNGTDWTVIGEVVGAGDSHVRLDYQFIDYDPIPGMSYYRLKQTDFDGQFEYFDPSVILYEPENLFRLFPNPVENYLNITTVSDLTDATIIVKNLNGKQENVTVSLSNGHQAQLEMGHLSTGVYLMEIVFPESVLTSRILKK